MVGTRTQWNVTKDFYMGLDVMYSKLESATTNVSPTLGAQTFVPESWDSPEDGSGQLVGPLPRPSRLLSLIG